MRAKTPRLHRDKENKPKGPETVRAPKWALSKVFKALCDLSQTSIGTKAYALFKQARWADLCSLTVDPRDYRRLSSRTFQIDYQIVSLFQKYSGFDGTVVDPKAKAMEKWKASEERCAVFNQRFRDRWDGKLLFSHHAEEAFYLARQKIRQILGQFPIEDFKSYCTFGPGSDLGTYQSERTGSYFKYKTPGHATAGAVQVLEEFFHDDARLVYSHSSQLCVNSRLFFVLKKWDEFRTAAMEPRWNGFLQKGFGRCMEANLRYHGIDIKTQADVNRRLASTAMEDGLATIDLRSASDSTCVNLVIDLLESDGETDELSDDWLDLILKLRTPYIEVPGYKNLVRQEKVSSMGNGYTFPLETLIFFGIAWGVCKHLSLDTSKISVFGDDIIVPRDGAQLVIELLSSIGYVPNVAKTFLRGEFFESCGHDYFRGRNVRPVFLKKEIDNVSDLYRLHNAFIDWGRRLSIFGNAGGCSNSIWRIQRSITSAIPRAYQLYGLPCESDGHLHASFDKVRPPRSNLGWSGFSILTWVPTQVKEYGGHYYGHLFSKLDGVCGTGKNDNLVQLRETGRMVKKKIFVADGYTDLIWSDA